MAKENASDLAASIQIDQLAKLVRHDPDRVRSWANLILNSKEPKKLYQMRNFGLGLASAFSSIDAVLSEKVFRHLLHEGYLLRTTHRYREDPLNVRALFEADDLPPLHQLKIDLFEHTFNDAELERNTAAAEIFNAVPWLDRYVTELLTSEIPAKQARARIG